MLIYSHMLPKNKKAFIKALYSRIEKVIQKKLPEGAIDIKIMTMLDTVLKVEKKLNLKTWCLGKGKR